MGLGVSSGIGVGLGFLLVNRFLYEVKNEEEGGSVILLSPMTCLNLRALLSKQYCEGLRLRILEAFLDA